MNGAALHTLRGINHLPMDTTTMTSRSAPRLKQSLGLLPAEVGLLWGAAALLAAAVWGPVWADSGHQHGFADQRWLLGIPCVGDVLSNLAFALAGLWGLIALWRLAPGALDACSRALSALFFVGLVATAAGSTAYHWQPQDTGLLWDRLGMVLPFAGLLGLAANGRVSRRAGWSAAGAVLVAGPLAVLWWARTGNVMPWAVVQLGGMLVVAVLALLPRRESALAVHLGAVIAMYALAKLFEAADHAVFDATAQWVSGHSLKHVLAAGAAWPVLQALAALRNSGAWGAPQVTLPGQNGAHTVGVDRRFRA